MIKKNLKIDDINIAYIDKGDKNKDDALIILHGWGAYIESIMPIFNLIEDRYVFAYDAPGFGASDAPNEVWGTYEYSEFLKKILDKLNLKSASFIGHSFGGKTLSIFAAKYPEKVKGLVLIDASGVLPKRTFDYYFKVYSYKLMKNISRIFKPFIGEKKLESFKKSHGSDDYNAAQGIMRKIFVKVVNESTESYFEKIKADTLLIWGKNDDATPLYMGEVFNKKIKNSGLVVLDGGHYSYLDDFNSFGPVLRSYLGEIK